MKIKINLPKFLKSTYKKVLKSGSYSPFELQQKLFKLDELVRADNVTLSARLQYYNDNDVVLIDPKIKIGSDIPNLLLIANKVFENVAESESNEEIQSFVTQLSIELTEKQTVTETEYVQPVYIPDTNEAPIFVFDENQEKNPTEVKNDEVENVPSLDNNYLIGRSFSEIDQKYDTKIKTLLLQKQKEKNKAIDLEAKLRQKEILKAQKLANKEENRLKRKAQFSNFKSTLLSAAKPKKAHYILIGIACFFGLYSIFWLTGNSSVKKPVNDVSASVVATAKKNKNIEKAVQTYYSEDCSKIISEFESDKSKYKADSNSMKNVAKCYLKLNKVTETKQLISDKKVTGDWLPLLIEKYEIFNQAITVKSNELDQLKNEQSGDVDTMLKLVDEVYSLKLRQSELFTK